MENTTIKCYDGKYYEETKYDEEIFIFDTYEEAQAWVREKRKKYGNFLGRSITTNKDEKFVASIQRPTKCWYYSPEQQEYQRKKYGNR